MSQKKCFKVIKYPAKNGLNFGQEIESFDNKEDAEKCKEEENKKIDKNNFIIVINEFEDKA